MKSFAKLCSVPTIEVGLDPSELFFKPLTIIEQRSPGRNAAVIALSQAANETMCDASALTSPEVFLQSVGNLIFDTGIFDTNGAVLNDRLSLSVNG